MSFVCVSVVAALCCEIKSMYTAWMYVGRSRNMGGGADQCALRPKSSETAASGSAARVTSL